jgi:hypothetical protein
MKYGTPFVLLVSDKKGCVPFVGFSGDVSLVEDAAVIGEDVFGVDDDILNQFINQILILHLILVFRNRD